MKITEKKRTKDATEFKFDNGAWVSISTWGNNGSWEYQSDEDDEETYSEGCLDFEYDTLIGYDGCYELPDEVVMGVEELGYNVVI
ncbi:MAG: hypothetical protein ACI3ZD_17565 [Prevotella sp.]